MLQKWQVLDTKDIFTAHPWVRVFVDKIKLPGGRIVDDFYRVELPEYTMVCALDDEGKILLERQYKHALKDISLAFPTGCLEDGESPFEGAKRELLEETGYEAKNWKCIGSYPIDGNKGCGKAHFFVAKGLKKISEPISDDMEILETMFMPVESVMKAIGDGEISILASVSLAAIVTNTKLMENFK